jgi:hypothetical protein
MVSVTDSPLPGATPDPAGDEPALKNPVPSGAQKTILFSDDLSRYRSDWDTGYTDKNKKLYSDYSAGTLHIRTGLSRNSTATNHKLFKNFNDFILDVDTRHVNGSIENWMGAEVRMKDDNNHYFLAISANGSYMISKTENRLETLLRNATRSEYISSGSGASNHLRIEADKDTLRLSANGHPLTTVTDNTFSGGMIDLRVVCAEANPYTEAAFSSLVITTT